MLISTEIASAAKLVGEEKAVEWVAKAGFDAWDFSMFAMVRYDWTNRRLLPNDHPLCRPDYLKFARGLRNIGLDNGIHCNQSHAPFPTAHPDIRGYMKRAIECTAEAGGKIVIIHPNNDASPEENAAFYLELLPFAKEHGVKIATENMWNWDTKRNCATACACSTPDSFMAHLDAVNDPSFVACLDIGHAEMRSLGTNAVEMIHALGGRLQALHIHDNDLVNDSHMIPFAGKIDFSAIIAALKAVNYQGYLTLEADTYLKAFTADTAFEGIRNLAAAANRLQIMYEDKQ